MNIIIGWIVAFGAAISGFLLVGGHAEQLWVPAEFLIILGAAMGAVIAANKPRNLRNLGKAFKLAFIRSTTSKSENTELLSLMFDLLQRIRQSGPLSIDADIANPDSSAIFSKYDGVMKKPRLVEFITDYFRMIIDGTMTLAQLETVMAQEIEVLDREEREASEAIEVVADSLPAFGIVAAICGVIHTLYQIGEGLPPAQVGIGIASALVGTLVGVFVAYAIAAPVARSLLQIAETELRTFQAVKEILIASYSKFPPMIAVEYGRKVLTTDMRPSMEELEQSVMSNTGQSMWKRS